MSGIIVSASTISAACRESFVEIHSRRSSIAEKIKAGEARVNLGRYRPLPDGFKLRRLGATEYKKLVGFDCVEALEKARQDHDITNRLAELCDVFADGQVVLDLADVRFVKARLPAPSESK